MMAPMRAMFLACSLFLSGCLLPQPDTPAIPPLMLGPDGQRAAAPVAVPQEGMLTNDRAGTLVDPQVPSANAQPDMGNTGLAAPEAPGRLSGVVSGLAVSRLAAVPEGGGEPVTIELASDGRFSLELPAGVYFLELAVGDQTLRVDQRVHVDADATRRITLTLEANKATLSEEAPLVKSSPSPSPKPAP